MHIKRLLGSYNRECPYGYKSRERHLPLYHSNRTVKVKIVNLPIDFL
jgi:hypothetical protein